MSELTNEEFIEFIESFQEGEYKNHKFFDVITEISRSSTAKRDSLIENNFQMYSLDDIAKSSRYLKSNLPKTTDAIYFKEDEYGKLSFYMIEFKFHNLDNPNARDMLEAIVDDIHDSTLKNKYKCLSNDFKYQLNKIKQSYGDNVEFSLIMKPIETINLVIPSLYKEYCQINKIQQKDIEKFLEEIDKRYFVFVSQYSQSGKHNIQKGRLESMVSGLRRNYERLKDGNVIDYYEIYSNDDFEFFLELEELVK